MDPRCENVTSCHLKELFTTRNDVMFDRVFKLPYRAHTAFVGPLHCASTVSNQSTVVY